MTETPEPQEDPDLNYLIAQLDPQRLGLIIIEGFKQIPFPKIEFHRSSTEQPLLFPNDPYIIALAHDGKLTCATSLQQLAINNPQCVADFIIDYCNNPDSEKA